MRASNLAVLALLLAGACAHYVETSTPRTVRWEDRDINELIAAIGPYDTTSVKGDWRSYDWFRFGQCHLVARTSLDGKIEKVELEGTGFGCDVYLQKLGSG
jgi:hypothetical protein